MELTTNKLSRKPLSFHAVSFGQDSTSSSLRRMVQISREIQDRAPRDPLAPAAAIVPSSYAEALDTVSIDSMLPFSSSTVKVFQHRSDLPKHS